ncbi:hypothetical protein [Alcaligenes faecalis]|uniref:hypothetical protein n=1 Tax=Alcaligenes faecalis TaxID=511 RepID=UPI000694618A|nr:hypothetical protein [Alcaligenes faecalis]ATH99995.1 hypothetical protein CPY64_09750 [Alcaligenes faecalis]AYZ92782.1 hypothetical protein EGY22_15520 [Alcaligenes faecalis]MCX5593552.1 hypothetical protein [Alcaligenes faecalis]QQC31411.1 hypothetical protein I6H81_12170 [Alcaligenes faecalis]CAJ0905649.1 DnaT domain-containing protein [Alcaligenes faecalis subsp. faecalis]
MLSASDLMRTIGRPIAYHPALARMVGGVNAAIFLSQLIYWDERMEDAELGVYKTAEQWEAETGLSVREQTTARRQLRDRGLITETHKRIEHKLYFKLDRDAFDRLIAGAGEVENPERQNVDSRNAETQFGNSESANTETPKAPSPNHPKRSSLIKTEITTETTEEKNTKKENSPSFSFEHWPVNPSPEVWADYLQHRKAIKAPLTQTAANRLGAEAHKAQAAGFSVDDFLAECMLRGWRGGKADWLTRGMSQDQPGGGPVARSGKFDPNAYIEERRRKRQAESQGGGDVVDV